jgi:tetratricopeptide (TPR) repeat protein
VLEVDRGEPAPPGTINIRVPPVVGGIIMKCLQKEPAHRFQTAGELAAEIKRYLHGGKVRATPPGPLRRLGRSIARRWRVAAGVVLLGAAVVGGAYVAARSERLAGLLGLAPPVASGGASGSKAGGEAERLRKLGVAHFRAGRHPQAVATFRQARDLRPDDAGLQYNYSVALWHAGGDAAEVARAMAEALRLDPTRARSARFQYEYARACERAGMPTEARAAFERVRRLDGSYKKGRVAAHLKGLGRQRR